MLHQVELGLEGIVALGVVYEQAMIRQCGRVLKLSAVLRADGAVFIEGQPRSVVSEGILASSDCDEVLCI